MGGLNSADVGYRSVRGPIASQWWIEGRRLRLEVSVPSVTEGGLPIDDVDGIVKVVSRGGDAVIVELGSGQYLFEALAPGTVGPAVGRNFSSAD